MLEPTSLIAITIAALAIAAVVVLFFGYATGEGPIS